MRRKSSQRSPFRLIARIAAVAVLSVSLLAPAAAQFWNPFGGSPQRPRQQPRQQEFNPFGGGDWWGGGGGRRRPEPSQRSRSRPQPQRQPAVIPDHTHAPPPARRAADAVAVTSPILVLGDGMADWLAYGLEDAFAEKPEFGIVRKHRAYSGLVRYDPKRDVEWPQVIRESVAADRPKYIVMMVGFHDRQPIRERTPGAPAAPARGGAQQPAPAQQDPEQDPDSPESRAKASAAQQNLELQKAQTPPETPPEPSAEPARPAGGGTMEFQTEAWQAAYVRRVDAAIAAMKSANVPVFWIGLPPQRNQRQAADAVFLNELYRTRAERAGIIFIDIWDGFVDEAGRYVLQGPDFEGQTRRLRSGDGIYFTRAGARKLAHYVEREILRSLISRQTPIALPAPEPAVPQPAKPGMTARPLAGPVIPLTAFFGGGGDLLGGSTAKPAPPGIDAIATRVLVRGEPITAPAGRADNFVWPRGSAAIIKENDPPPSAQPAVVQAPPRAQPPSSAAAAPPGNGQPTEAKRPRRTTPRAQSSGAPRPPMGIPFFR
jgi:hypothetical protein